MDDDPAGSSSPTTLCETLSNAIRHANEIARRAVAGRFRRFGLGWLDFALLAAVGLGAAFVVYRINTSLDYRWDWSVVVDVMVHYDSGTEEWRANLLLLGLLTTIRAVLWGGVFALLIGVTLGLCRVSPLLLLRLISRTYIDGIRGIPPLVIIFVFYFFISSQIIPLLGVEQFLRSASPNTLSVILVAFGPPELVPAFISAALCLAFFEAAYVAEIVRAGIQSVERGQWEAAVSLGLSQSHTMRFVILPQAIQRMMPPLAGQFISLIKDSSIASLISVQELAFMAAQVSASTFRIFEIWISVAGMYFVMCYVLTTCFGVLERRMRRGVQ